MITDFLAPDSCSAVAIQRDGKIVAAGTSHKGDQIRAALARYLAE